MIRKWLAGLRRAPAWSCVVALAAAGFAHAGDGEAELRALVEQQGREIEELKKQIRQAANLAQPGPEKLPAPGPAVQLDDAAVKRLVADYLKDNPGAGMPPSVQTGYSDQGFVIRSAPNPNYVRWEDECRIPFELRIRGQVQLDYYGYKVTDRADHLRNRLANAEGDPLFNPTGFPVPDTSVLMVKRARLFFEGTAFTPDFRYRVTFDGNTRGINSTFQRPGAFNNPIGNVQGGDTTGVVDHATRLFQAWIAYDFHGCARDKGCGGDCPEGTYKYAPVYTLFVGKSAPLIGLEETLGSANQQFVEFSMADWYFDNGDDNMVMMAGAQVRAFEDRLFGQLAVTNGNETQTPSTLMDNLPGLDGVVWYDFGGSWNRQRNRWDLYGDSISDIDWSVRPVVRVGGAFNLVPMGRRSLYGDAEQNRVRVVPGQPNGAGILGASILNGNGFSPIVAGNAASSRFGLDSLDEYIFDVYWAGKYRGWSVYNEWWVRDLCGFKGEPIPGTNQGRPILYQANRPGSFSNFTALFPNDHAIIDIGAAFQVGYFIIPRKLEIAGRYSFVSGQSGNLLGDGNQGRVVRQVVIPDPAGGAPVTANVIQGAFRNFHTADEIAIGVNYFFKRQMLKWSADVGYYRGGNPASNAQSVAGFMPG
ncbi:MAG TPA: hypothetical protein VFA26_16665, partial [Gemmataceae bacterium]|nr:hypothetical protein [Gemmataceae bacterium]